MFTELLVFILYSYAIIGAIFGFYFVWWGAARIDPDAHPLPVALRFMLWPASAVLWPTLLLKLLRNR